MSNKHIDAVYESTIGPQGTRAVALVLANMANPAGLCRPGSATIAGHTQLSRRQVWRCLTNLEQLGVLERAERTRGNGSRTANVYRLNLAALRVLKRKVSVEERLEMEAYFDDDFPDPSTPPAGPDSPDSPDSPDDPDGDDPGDGDAPPVTGSHRGSDTGSHRGSDTGVTGVVTPASPPDPCLDPSEEPKEGAPTPSPLPADEPGELALVPLDAVPSEAAVKKPPTVDQRANALATVYYDLVGRMASFPGTRQIVKRALNAGYPDDRIEAALRRLADRGATARLDTLREELDGSVRRGRARPTASSRAAAVLAHLDDEAAGT